VAELLKSELGVEAKMEEGDRGEFTVRVGDRIVTQKGWIRFPADQQVLSAVRQALAG
jgi:hypothetical protein